jgi:hypothetical protein
MPDTLHTPSREHIVTTNAWAFQHWLRTTRGHDLPDWPALQRWSVSDPATFGQAVAAYARLANEPLRLARHAGPQEALILRRSGNEHIVLSRDDIRTLARHPPGTPSPSSQGVSPTSVAGPPATGMVGTGPAMSAQADHAGGKHHPLPADIAAPLTRLWPPGLLIRPLADLLLHADLRPDDRLLVAGSVAWPWLAGLLEGTTVILGAANVAGLLAAAADAAATVLVAPAPVLAEAAFLRPRQRPNLARMRTIIATGGPLSPEGRTRIYTWIKSDVMLLARTGDTFWGNPLEPVYARPAASPGFFTPPASNPAIP